MVDLSINDGGKFYCLR